MNQRKKRGPDLDRIEKLKNLQMEREIQNSECLPYSSWEGCASHPGNSNGVEETPRNCQPGAKPETL